jgi:hypothetical protein
MSKRSAIVDELVKLIAKIDGEAPYTANLFNNVKNRMVFPDQIHDFPTVCVTAGRETREYHPSQFTWAWLSINIRVYVNAEDTLAALEPILEDIENVIDSNNRIEYETGRVTEEIRVSSVNTDEGILSPLGVGEIQILVRYDL